MDRKPHAFSAKFPPVMVQSKYYRIFQWVWMRGNINLKRHFFSTDAFQYTAFWSNVVTHVVVSTLCPPFPSVSFPYMDPLLVLFLFFVQISMRKHDTNGTKGVVGGQIADMVLAYLKDVQFLEKAFYYVPAPDKINRKAALGVLFFLTIRFVNLIQINAVLLGRFF